ncbi:MAG: STT3 domain-containing protein [Planctomycetota bacterium]
MTDTAPIRSLSWRYVLAALGVAASGFVLRVVPFLKSAFPEGGAVPSGLDAFYHLRRIRAATAEWPRVPSFDAWMGVPNGGTCIWPPLFDWIPATFARVTGLDPVTVAFFWPPFLAAVGIVVVIELGRRLSGVRAGLLAGAVFALLPTTLLAGLLGRVDHHIAEAFMLPLFACGLLSLADALDPASETDPGSARARASSAGLALGVFQGIALTLWAGSILYAGAIGLAFVLLALTLEQSSARRVLARAVLIAQGVALVAVLPHAGLAISWGDPFTPNALSLLQPALLLLAAATPCAIVWARSGERPAARALLGLGSLVAVLAAVAVAAPSSLAGLGSGLSFLTREQSPWLAEIIEFQPMLSSARARSSAVAGLGWAAYALPLALVGTLFLLVRGRVRRPRGLVVLACLIVVVPLPFLQIRFLVAGAAVVALGMAVAIDHALRRGVLSGVITVLLALALLSPAANVYQAMAAGEEGHPGSIGALLHNLLIRLRRTTAPAGNAGDFATPPPYAVLARWDMGHALLYLGERGVVANNFGEHLGGQAFQDTGRFFHTEDPQEAFAIARSRRARYVITTIGAEAFANPRRRDSFAVRLHRFDGSGGKRGSGHFRLIDQSEPELELAQHPEGRLPRYKVYEIVSGARLLVMGAPGARIDLHQRLAAGDQTLRYQRTLTVGAKGQAEIRLPYPGDVTLKLPGGLEGVLPITEEAIQTGATLTLDLR